MNLVDQSNLQTPPTTVPAKETTTLLKTPNNTEQAMKENTGGRRKSTCM